MKRILLVLIVLAMTLSIFAKPVIPVIAGEIAMGWLTQTQPLISVSAMENVSLLQLPGSSGDGIYLVTLKPTGFVLVSADDRVKPILGFSLNSAFADNQQPQSVQWFLSSYAEQIRQITSDSSLTPHPEWVQISQHQLSAQRNERDVTPMLTTTWNQTWPYNNLCPVDANLPSGHVDAGCMATAVAQVIKYWSYPIHGTGFASYVVNPWGEIYANFGDATYNYSSMPNNLTNNADADISLLMFHAGAAMNMQYSSTAGGTASPADARTGMIDHFSYSDTAILRNFTQTGEDDWIDFLTADLELGRPIIQYGSETAGANANAWIVDGVLNTNYFHVNWGFGGTFNGFYYMNNLRPGQYWYNTNIGGIFEVHPFAFVPAPTNVQAHVQDFVNVNLQWQPVTEILPTGYEIYRNQALLTTINNPNAQIYLDQALTPGTYVYYLKTRSLYGTSDPSNSVTVVVFSAPVINYTNGFEGMTDYAVIGFPWQAIDLDMAPTVIVNGYEYPSAGVAGSFFTIRPLYMIPPNWDITMHQGFKCAASFGAVNVTNNDWLITPIWNTGNTAELRFWAKSDVGTHQASLLNVGYSLDPINPTQMTVLSGPTPIVLPAVWTEYVFTIPQHYNTNVVVCFQNLSSNGYLLLIDDITLHTGVANDDNTDTQTPAISNLKVYPNPAMGNVNISFDRKSLAPVTVKIYDTKGRIVRTINDVTSASDTPNLNWDGLNDNGASATSGMYLLKVSTAGQTQTRKVVLLQK